MTGIPVIAEIMFSDFIAVAFDILANQMAKTRYMTGGQVTVPVVVRTHNGGGSRPAPSTPVRGELVHDPRAKSLPSTPRRSRADGRLGTTGQWFSSSTSRSSPPRGGAGGRDRRRTGVKVVGKPTARSPPSPDGAPALQAAERLAEEGSPPGDRRRTSCPSAPDDPRLGGEDQSPVHGGENPRLWLGRRDRLDRVPRGAWDLDRPSCGSPPAHPLPRPSRSKTWRYPHRPIYKEVVEAMD